MAARDGSRTPRNGALSAELQQLIVDRERARFTKDFDMADSLRERLLANGITLFDKTSSWKAEDGRSGQIPKFAELDKIAEGGTVLREDLPRTEFGQEEAHIRQLVSARERARAAKDFAESDRLRDELKALGVELFDKEKTWQSASGFSGCIIGYRGSDEPTDREITTLVQEREKARENTDYDKADMIRRELAEAGVEIQDKQKTWRARDGRSGPVPTWDQVKAGGSPTFGGPPSGSPIFGGPPASRAPHAEDLRSQLLNAAAQAAMNPAIAHRALHMLQSMIASAPPLFAPPTSMPPPAPPMRRKAPGASPTSHRSPEEQQAFDFVRHCADRGTAASDPDICWLVETRERMRHKKDFQGADDLRDAMRGLGIELNEREKRWQSADGRSGVIPAWGELGL